MMRNYKSFICCSILFYFISFYAGSKTHAYDDFYYYDRYIGKYSHNNSNYVLSKAVDYGIDGDELVKITRDPLPKSTIVNWSMAINCLPYAILSDAIYDHKKVIVDDWIKVDMVDGAVKALSGFHAATYRNINSDEIVVVFEGTNPISNLDWGTNIRAFVGIPTFQHVFAFNYMAEVFDKYGPNITVTGHSLGGGIAQMVGSTLGLKTITFNAANVPLLSEIGNNNQIKDDRLVNIYLGSDPVNAAYSSLGKVTSIRLGHTIVLAFDVETKDKINLLSNNNPHNMNVVIQKITGMKNFVCKVLSKNNNDWRYVDCKNKNNSLEEQILLPEKWSTKIHHFEEGGWSGFTPPTVQDNRVYGGILKTVFALDSRTGALVWKRDLSWYVTHQRPALDVEAGYVWVSTGGMAYKLNKNTGAIAQKTSLPGNGYVKLTRYAHGKEVVLGKGGLYVIDNGRILWRNRDIKGDGFSIYKGIIYAGERKKGQPTHMVGLDLWSGKILRKFPTDSWARWKPSVHLGVLYFVDIENTLYALDIDVWTLRWKQKLKGRPYSPPVIHKGILYITTDNTYAIDALSGKILWRQPFGQGTASPFVGADGLYVIRVEYTADKGSADRIPVFRGPEEIMKSYDADTIANIKKRIEKGGYKGNLIKDGYGFKTFIYLLDIDNGAVLWKAPMPLLTDSDCTPTEIGRTLYVGTNDGVFRALVRE